MSLKIRAAVLSFVIGVPFALGAPRQSVTLTNVLSDSPNGGTLSNQDMSAFSFPVKFLSVKGTLTPLLSGSYAREATINVTPPSGRAFTMVPSNLTLISAGTAITETIFKLPTPLASVAGAWAFRFDESFDDGAGADARWDSVTITWNDGPPTNAQDLGGLPAGTITLPAQTMVANQVRWYRFILANDVKSAAGTYLDIDTEGSALGGTNDPFLLLYDADGNAVASDDDSGSSFQAHLTFGAGTRPAVGNGLPYDGNDGPLDSGTYYLAVFGSNAGDTAAIGWNVISAYTTGGTIKLNIRTSAGAGATSPFCPGDFNKNGTKSVQDLFDYLKAYFATCP